MVNQKTTKQNQIELTIVMLSAACCMPGMTVFDEQAERIIRQALSETGIDARLEIIPASKAFFSGAFKKIMNELMVMMNQGKIGAPAILINNQVISYGVPALEIMKEALYRFDKERKEQ
ncbi:MAG: hypothetical protein M1365_09225 [Actinobacteria bacterium]|nr:hypothetical protein [Actinomycetota bacterium]